MGRGCLADLKAVQVAVIGIHLGFRAPASIIALEFEIINSSGICGGSTPNVSLVQEGEVAVLIRTVLRMD